MSKRIALVLSLYNVLPILTFTTILIEIQGGKYKKLPVTLGLAVDFAGFLSIKLIHYSSAVV